MRTSSKPASVSMRAHVIVREAEPDVAHLLPVALAIVRQHVDDDDAAARLEHARDLGQRARPAPARDAARASASPRRAAPRRSAALRARRAGARRCRAPGAAFGGLQHRGRRVDRDDARDERRERRAHLPGAAAEIADDPVALGQSAASAARWKRSPNSSSRSRSHWPADEEKNSCDFVRGARERCLQPPLILRCGRRGRRPVRARAARAGAPAASSSSRVIVYRWLVPSARAVTQPPSASAFRCRLTVDCGSCMTAQSSDTVSSADRAAAASGCASCRRARRDDRGWRGRADSSVKPDERIYGSLEWSRQAGQEFGQSVTREQWLLAHLPYPPIPKFPTQSASCQF